jgi:predicted  nucleic acid-binding Zn-ribbon protein
VSRVEFNKIRNEIDSLKTRSINRLNEIKQTAGSKRFLELLNEIQDAEREEDRAAKDLLNLYDQYHSRRMREDTFRRLLPNYRKRWDAVTNHLSDLLNMAQKEGKQA